MPWSGRGKKLVEAAAHWARALKRASSGERPEPRQPGAQPEWQVDQAAWDAAAAWAEQPPEPQPGDGAELATFSVWPENWPTVLLFWRVRRCWRVAPMGGLVGMDWQQVQSKAELTGLRGRKRLAREIARLEAMEEAVLEELSRE